MKDNKHLEDEEFSPDFFQLDKYKLDEEWVKQPKLYRHYAELLVDAREEHEQAKSVRELVSAELDKKIRAKPGFYGLEKITEPAVKLTVLLQNEYKDANSTVIKSKHKMDVLQVAVDTLDHRKKALENLVHLFLANYFSRPAEPNDERKRELRNRGRVADGRTDSDD